MALVRPEDLRPDMVTASGAEVFCTEEDEEGDVWVTFTDGLVECLSDPLEIIS